MLLLINKIVKKHVLFMHVCIILYMLIACNETKTNLNEDKNYKIDNDVVRHLGNINLNGFDKSECIPGYRVFANNYYKILLRDYLTDRSYYVTSQAYSAEKKYIVEYPLIRPPHYSICVHVRWDNTACMLYGLTYKIWPTEIILNSVSSSELRYPYPNFNVHAWILTKKEYDQWMKDHPDTKFLTIPEKRVLK